ncbi:transmembrane 220 family protein [Aliifodinibius sp. S!AR15-10]|uniref:transmembrane 220 family protein n=1 Tax=Aliifodinibius sp. S!AR15-10 TaxID=2950437 RepID=UPI002867423B|nr:transmembrane 220 family protein [Aliifodinibius sp. S!AR15-10]MDR8390169.1 transmembrane 220 family protein [Aliifodinibius sp. S!AR15-10]
MKHKVMIVLNYVMGSVFIFAAVMQYNDPDMVGWIAMYGAAAAASLLYATGNYKKIVSAVVLVAALTWAALIFPEFFEGESFSFRTFSSVKMTNMEFETAREFGGLVIISLWMALTLIFPPASRE